jgi:hypothetical protein
MMADGEPGSMSNKLYLNRTPAISIDFDVLQEDQPAHEELHNKYKYK